MHRSWLVLLVVAASSRIAAADDPRRAAEQMSVEAQRDHDEAKFLACGKAYLDVYNADPKRPDNDEVLYNAAICFQEGKAVGGAMQAFEMVLRYYPSSKVALRALAQMAAAYARIARFDQAAARYEEYAKKYAGEKDARDAIENAIVMRTAIGDTAKRIEDTKYFVQTYGAKAPQEAADATFALVTAYDTPADQVKALREYLRVYGAKGGREKLAVAYGRIGDALWRQSCPVSSFDGLCVKLVREQTPRCDPAAIRVVTVARTAAVRKDALAAYDQAIKVVDEAGLKDPGSIHVAAMAKVARADDELERMIDQAFPTGLDFAGAGKQRSMKRFQDWLADETKRGEALNHAYEAVLAMKDPSASIAAAARIGQMAEAFARAMAVGEIPKDVRSGEFAKDKVSAYCDTLHEAAEPLRARAVESFAVCVDKAVQLGVVDDWVAVCRRDGAQLDAKRFPQQEVQPELAFAIPAAVERSTKSDPAAATSNLGEVAWRAGQREEATRQWEAALAKNGKLFAAHVNLAIAAYEKMRALPARDPQRKQLANDAELHASNALAVDSDPLPLVVLAAIAADSGDKRKLELARAYLEQAIRVDDKSTTVLAARAVVAARRGEWTFALSIAERAVTLAPHAEAALRVAGILGVRAGQFDTARTRLATIKTPAYDVLVARAIAARGLGDPHAAETLYQQAIQLDPARAEAHYDLGLYYELHAQPLAPTRAAEEYRRAAAIDPKLDRKP
jgi:tetratricopeptide (TPR) repeat protein